MTSANCFLYFGKDNVVVTAGLHDIRNRDGMEQEVGIEILTVHEGYTRARQQDDIALLKVTPRFQLNKNVQPILLPSANYDPTQGNAVVSGWGTYGDRNTTFPTKLMDLLQSDGPHSVDPSVQRGLRKKRLCLWKEYHGKSNLHWRPHKWGQISMYTRRRGALAQKFPNGSFVQIGIVSGAHGCESPDYPYVYTKVSKYLDWIRAHMK